MTQIEKIFYLPDLTIRSLAAQEVALQICTDFTPSELLFYTELFFFSHGIHGIHGNADASPAEDTISDVLFYTEVFLFHTECTDITEFTLRVPSGFEFFSTDFLLAARVFFWGGMWCKKKQQASYSMRLAACI